MGKVCWKPRLRAISRRAEGGGWGPQGPQMPGSSWTGREWARHHGGHRGDLARVSTEHGWQHWGAPGATVSGGGPCPTADAPAMAAPRGTPDLPPLPDLRLPLSQQCPPFRGVAGPCAEKPRLTSPATLTPPGPCSKATHREGSSASEARIQALSCS